jgi:hypothetical protein
VSRDTIIHNFEQDNESAIKMEKNGAHLPDRSRHINIRYFFTKIN